MIKTVLLKKPDNVEELVKVYKENELVYYYPIEEFFNVLTHIVGVLFGFIGMIMMLIKASSTAADVTAVFSSIGFMALFLNSSLYHGIRNIGVKRALRRLDYASINLMVVSCGTGACLLYGSLFGYIAYGVCMTITVAVMFICIRYFGKLRHCAIISNFINGALLTSVFFTVRHNIPAIAAQFYIAGVVLVLIGAALFGIKTRFIHTVFHIFVLTGPICFYFANYFQL